MDTEFVSTGNIIEGCFWLGVSVFFWVPAFRRGEKNRGFCFYGAAVFVCSACSDFYEAHTGAWWQPWWLILWNMGHFLGLVGMIVWYARIRGSFSKVISELRRQVKSDNSTNEVQQDEINNKQSPEV